jgi:hypothetical protein
MPRLRTTDIPNAAGLLVRCFSDDALIAAQLEGVSDKETFLEALFRMQLEMFVETMHVFSLDDGGQTLFVGYEKQSQCSLGTLYYGLKHGGTLSRSVPKGDLKRFGANSRRIASQFKQDWHKQFVARNFYYIKIMAIDPSQRGHGRFRLMIDPVLKSCQARNLPVVLETNTVANCAIYEHFGFVRKKTFHIRPNGFDVFCYVKE